MVIEARRLTKVKGSVTAVDAVSFSVRSGRVTALLGPNGGGKTSTLRLICGLDVPTSGSVLVDGEPFRDSPAPASVLGSLVDGAAVHPSWRVETHLRAVGATAGMGQHRIVEVMDTCGLSSLRRRRGRELSLGMRQRLGIALALLASPACLVLDEPANGLDPEGMRWLRGLLRAHADAGGTTLVSSHLMSELHGVADDVLIIVAGRVVWSSTMSDFVAAHSTETTIVGGPAISYLAGLVRQAGGSVRERPGELEVTGISRQTVGQVAHAAHCEVSELRSVLPPLEDIYVSFIDAQRHRSEEGDAQAARHPTPCAVPA